MIYYSIDNNNLRDELVFDIIRVEVELNATKQIRKTHKSY